jgi:hypothetical protein
MPKFLEVMKVVIDNINLNAYGTKNILHPYYSFLLCQF